MNNGIFVQDIYGKTGFENSLPKPLLGSTNVIPTPYHFTPSTEWSINYNNLVMVVDTSLITSPVISFLAGGGSATPWSIDWGDGYVDNFSSYNNTSVSHSYSQRGIFIIQIRGNMSAPKITTNALIRILSFGTFSTSASYLSQGGFNNNINLIDIPNNIPSTATSLQSLFLICNKLNDTDLSLWNTSNVTDMSSMFQLAGSFNQSLNNWNVSKVTNMTSMFNTARSFNQDLDLWNTAAVTSMDSMFTSAITFNGKLNLNVSNVTQMGNLFNGASSFNQPIGSWNVANVVQMGNMFLGAGAFNQSLNDWNVRKVTNFAGMFTSAINFNSSLDNWQLGLDTAGTSCNSMFLGAQLFNQNLTSWNVSKVNNMGSMFACFGIPGGFTPSAFQGDISNWNLAGLSSSTSLDNFMLGKNGTSRYSTANYDALLIGWNNNKLAAANGIANWRTDLRPHFGEARYTSGGDAAAARAALVTYGWTITDGGPVVSNPDAQSWISRVYSNGGTVSSSTAVAVNDFCNAIDSAGIRNSFLRLNLFCGDQLAAALVPLYRGGSLSGTQYGNATDTNFNFVSGDYVETGINGGLKGNGANKYLRTGLQMRTPPYTFASLQITQGMHLAISATSVDTTGSANFITMIGGNGQFGGTVYRIMSAPRAFAGGSSPESSQSIPISASNPDQESLIIGVRDPGSPSLQRLYQGGSQTATQATVSVFDAGANHEFAILANWNNGSPNRYSSARARMYSIGYAMTESQVLAYTNAVNAFNTALNRS